MEPVELSLQEQIVLFHCLAKAKGTDDKRMWQKGAELCMQKDIEDSVKPNDRSELRGYLYRTLETDNRSYSSLEMEDFEWYIDEGIRMNVLNSEDKTKIFAEIVMSDISLGATGKEHQENLEKILSNFDVRLFLKHKIKKSPAKEFEHSEPLKRAYTRLENYERKMILRESSNGLGMNQTLRKVLGGKMAKAVKEGIAPHKTFTRQLPHDKITIDTLAQARMIADETNQDKLEKKQKDMIKHKKIYDQMIDKDIDK